MGRDFAAHMRIMATGNVYVYIGTMERGPRSGSVWLHWDYCLSIMVKSKGIT